MPSMSKEKKNILVKELSMFSLRVRTVPSLQDLTTKKASIEEIRDLDYEDILERNEVNPEESLMKKIFKKVLMVTGAGGSIGSEICRQVLKFKT